MIRKSVYRYCLAGAFSGLLVGIGIFLVLNGLAPPRSMLGEVAEDRMWMALFASLWGLPLSGLVDVVDRSPGRTVGHTVAILLLNWALIGTIVGGIVGRLRAPVTSS